MSCQTLSVSEGDDTSGAAAPPPDTTGRRGPVQIVFPPDARTRVTPTTSSPWGSLGQLVVRFPNAGTYTGTGVLIDDRHVLTAAHNVFGNDVGGFATRCVFLPARDGSVLHGSVDVDRVCVTEEYRSLSPADPDSLPDGEVVDYTAYTEDYAVVRLATPVANPALTLLAADDAVLDHATGTVAGYPGDKPDGTLWTSSGGLGVPDASFLFYRIDTYRGQSGAPVLLPRPGAQPAVVGVHVAGDRDLDSNFAVRLTSDRVQQIRDWASG